MPVACEACPTTCKSDSSCACMEVWRGRAWRHQTPSSAASLPATAAPLACLPARRLPVGLHAGMRASFCLALPSSAALARGLRLPAKLPVFLGGGLAPTHVRSMPGSTSLLWERSFAAAAAAPSQGAWSGGFQVPRLGEGEASLGRGRKAEAGAGHPDDDGIWEALGLTPCKLVESAALALVHIMRLHEHGHARVAADIEYGGGGGEDGASSVALAWGMAQRLARHVLPWTSPSFPGRWQPAVASFVCTMALALEPRAAGSLQADGCWDGRQAELGLSLWRACRGLLSSRDDAVLRSGLNALGRLCWRARGLAADRWQGGLGRAILRWAVQRQVLWLEGEGAHDGVQDLSALRILAAIVPVDPDFLVGCAHDQPPLHPGQCDALKRLMQPGAGPRGSQHCISDDGGAAEQGSRAARLAWLSDHERTEYLLEAEQAALCDRLLDGPSPPLDGEREAVLRRQLMPWCLQILDACLAQMDATRLFHCEAALSLATRILAYLPSPPYHLSLQDILDTRCRGRSQGGKHGASNEPRATTPETLDRPASRASWPLRCIERAVSMLKQVPPEASATADSPMCRMMRVSVFRSRVAPPLRRRFPPSTSL